MNNLFGYIRVSTVKQGEHGVSLVEQRAAIERYAQANQVVISHWFEEQETAAKRGRPIFGEMIRLLRRGAAVGVVMHKIDRSARNLKDWADLGELIDAGVRVNFANEALDLNSRGGRLSADIQAVVASDYIRNLREETMKGIYGRFKQGLYPRPAPIGYLDQGGGNPKKPDPIRAPLIRKAFELYSSGSYSLAALSDELHTLGLRTRSGGRLSVHGLAHVLHNPFYTGLIKIAKTGETYQGAHKPIVPMALSLRVRDILHGKISRRVFKNQFVFRQLIRCAHCGRCLIGERQKGHVYYRCHARCCPSRTVREEAIHRAVIRQFLRLELSQGEKDYARAKLLKLRVKWADEKQAALAALRLQFSQADERLNRLTDAYLDQIIDKQLFEQRKTALLEERRHIQDRLQSFGADGERLPDQLSEAVELAGSAYLCYIFAVDEEKRDLLKLLSSNRQFKDNSLIITLNSPFDRIANRFSVQPGSPSQHRGRDVGKAWDILLPKLFAALPTPIQLRNNTP